MPRRDVRRIGKALSQRISHDPEEWADHLSGLGRDAARHTAHLAEIARDRTFQGADQLRRDPVPAIAIIGTGLLLFRLLRRR